MRRISTSAWANFGQALLAVLLGNVAYFLLLPHSPRGARHVPFRLDPGLILDFGFCVAAFAIIKAIARRKRDSRS
jgi:hypothetical protein